VIEFSSSERQFILSRAAQHYETIIEKEYGDSGLSDFRELLFSSLTIDEWEKSIELEETLLKLYLQRRHELHKFLGISTDDKHDGVDTKHIPFRLIQIGMFLLWRGAAPIKENDEDEKDFQKRKDWHDYLLGYVNHDAIRDPLISLKDVIAEYDKQQKIVENTVSVFVRFKQK
jgi:hypothetical protein